MKTQVEYESNIDYEATYERLVSSPYVVEQSRKGTLTVYINKATVNLFPDGKVQVAALNPRHKRLTPSRIRPYLVALEGEKLSLRAYGVHFHSPWPPPDEFEFAACNRVFRYKHLNEPLAVTLATMIIMSIVGFVITKDLSNTAMPLVANQTGTGLEIVKLMIPVYPYLALTPMLAAIIIIAFRARQWLRTKVNMLSTTNIHS